MNDDSRLRARALTLFERVIELPDEAREAVLLDACRDEPELLAMVRALLQADTAPHPLLDSEPHRLTELLDEDADGSELPGSPPGRIGPYRLIEEAGRGGMARVFLAEREVGDVRQRVALKLVKRGIDTDEVLRRFAHETRVLASLEHPNIARFHDAGASPDGRPYLVMEYIEGLPLTEYCDGHRLGVDRRLELFLTVCEAVQFAHQRLVVHRDIKPSNVLVTERGDVKLLDFGIAKLLSDEPDEVAALTRTSVRVLTPEYAAPEQRTGEPITTATDVYALGSMLYELLSGTRPGARDRERADAPPPSTALRRAAGADGIAAARGTSKERLRRRLSGDLDRIVLKALEDEASARYRTAEQLLDDLERYRAGLPVRARPNTIGYRARKYARRHRAGLAAMAAGLTFLAIFAGFHTVRIAAERDRAQDEADRAQATTEFLQRLLGDAYPSVALGDTFSMGDLLRRAAGRVDSVADQPELQAELLRTLGDIHREQGQFTEALPLLERAVALHRASGRELGRSAGRALDALGHLHYEAKNIAAARDAHAEALAIYERLFEPDDSLVLFAMNNLATAEADLGNTEEGLRLHREVLARSPRLFADTSQLMHVTHNNLGRLLGDLGRDDEAEVELREALRIRRIALPPDHPSTSLTMNNLANLLSSTGRLDEAERLQREAYEAFVRVVGPDHHRVGLTAYTLGSILQQMGRFEEADSFLRITIAVDRRAYGERHPEVGVDLRRLGTIQRDAGDCETAAATFAEADAIYADNDLPLSDRRRILVRTDLANCLRTLGRHAEALALAPDTAVATGNPP